MTEATGSAAAAPGDAATSGAIDRIVAALVDDRLQTMSSGALRVWVALLAHAGPDGLAWPAKQRLARVTGLAQDSSVRRAIRELIELGLVTTARPSRGRHSTTYRLAAATDSGGVLRSLGTRSTTDRDGLSTRSVADRVRTRSTEDRDERPTRSVADLNPVRGGPPTRSVADLRTHEEHTPEHQDGWGGGTQRSEVQQDAVAGESGPADRPSPGRDPGNQVRATRAALAEAGIRLDHLDIDRLVRDGLAAPMVAALLAAVARDPEVRDPAAVVAWLLSRPDPDAWRSRLRAQRQDDGPPAHYADAAPVAGHYTWPAGERDRVLVEQWVEGTHPSVNALVERGGLPATREMLAEVAAVLRQAGVPLAEGAEWAGTRFGTFRLAAPSTSKRQPTPAQAAPGARADG